MATKKTGMQLHGFKELNEALLQQEAKLQKKAVADAGKYAMKPVLQYQQEHVQVDTGDTKLALGISTSRAKLKGTSRVFTVFAGMVKKTTGAAEGKKNFVGPLQGEARKKRELVGVEQKALAQEYGTTKQQADPFIRPSLSKNIDVVISRLKEKLAEVLLK